MRVNGGDVGRGEWGGRRGIIREVWGEGNVGEQRVDGQGEER